MPQTFLKIFLVSIASLTLLRKGQSQEVLDQQIAIIPGRYSSQEITRLLQEQGTSIAFSSDKLPKTSCDITQSPMTVAQLLETLGECSGIKYELRGKTILISYQKRPARRYLRGIVRDAESGEVLIGATVQKMDNLSGVITNSYGYYSMSLREGTHILRVRSIGYHDLIDTVELATKSRIRNLKLIPKIEELNEVVVSAMEPDFNVNSLIPGFNTLDLSTRGEIPYFMGEVDVLQGATLLPGITTLGEDGNGLNIRGANADQNLILLDEAPIYNPNHLNGLISVFNPEAVNNVEIMKGFIPPAYGGRASSVITVHQKEGNSQDFHITGGIGLVSAKLIAEGPLKKEKSSFILSARQSLLDISSFTDNTSKSNFQDLNAKINWKYNSRNTFFASAYFGNDRNTNIFNTVRNWGNANYSFRWNHLYGKRTFANYSLVVSEYNYRITQPQEAASYIGRSRIKDYTLKADHGFVINPSHEIQYGGSITFHRLKPGDRIPYDDDSSSSNPLYLDSEHGFESALYVSHQARFTDHLSAHYGLRISSLYNIGPSTVYLYDPSLPKSDQSIIDTLNYEGIHIVKKYTGWEPRASLVYKMGSFTSLKAAYTRSFQYVHLISSTITPSPTDIWKLSDTYVPPTESNLFSLGLYRNFNQNKWEAYVDGYYKRLSNTVEYKAGADLLFNENPETELLRGQGRTYGVEFFLKKNEGKLTGWLSYTLSKSETKVKSNFEEETINNGQYFPTDYDKRHDVSLVGIYELLPRLSASFSFNFNTGRPYTLPVGKYYYEGNLVPQFGFRNQSRLPDYHRLDVSVKWQSKRYKRNGSFKKYQDYWTLAVYNVYARKNVYSYVFEENETTGETTVTPYTIFDTVIPGITYHFKF